MSQHDYAISALWHADENPNPEPRRRDVEWVLQRVADGHHDADDMEFMRALAQRLLDAGQGGGTRGGERANRVLKASGLWGRKKDDAVEAMETAEQFGGTHADQVAFAKQNNPEAMRRVRDPDGSSDPPKALVRRVQRFNKRQK